VQRVLREPFRLSRFQLGSFAEKSFSPKNLVIFIFSPDVRREDENDEAKVLSAVF